jgi:glycosyltransferase 2 family protein
MPVSNQETPSIPHGSETKSLISKFRKFLPIIISFGLTVLIGYVLYRDVPNWRESVRLMIQGNIPLILAGTFFEFLHICFRAARWGSLLSTVKPNIRFKNLFSLTIIKYVINVVPPRSGEIAASILLARKENISSATVIAASVFERILDLFSVFMIFTIYLVAWGLGIGGNTEGGAAIIFSIRSYSIKALFIFMIGLAVLVLLLRNAHWAARVPSRIRIPMMGFLEGFRSLQSHGDMLRVILLSIAVWLCITLQTWFLVSSYIKAFPLIGATLIVVMTAVGVAIPTPAGVGGYQYFMSLALINFFGRLLSPIDPHSQAAGISNACYLVSVIPIFIAGLFFLNREGLSFHRISSLRNLSNPEL